ncbi:hypothetical protein Clacol_001513 [Clathrus columnatus]|uniref:Glycoside hydrolase family 5 C-terminal domain-containing protein n=1 Tax=Clathrus columnatus TaxID=1419009 RepID=A0AAV5A145_9AGAM|nr:hypothetical protein Clacol_001513 [Clathrus columnatus]
MSSSSLSGSFVVLESTHNSVEDNYIPGSSDSYAHDWSKASIQIQGRHLVDKYGRICYLRGVNLSGNCKTPSNVDKLVFPSHPELATFVNRPFPLEDAPEHFARLRRWGLTFITWEALAPASPTEFSTEYLEYLRSLLSLLPRFGLVAFVSLHQDVWSRYSGGSGAPAWTLSSVGLSIDALEETGAAWLGGVNGKKYIREEEKGLWPTGYQKLAAATMHTCFWAGDTFAPKLKISDPKGTASDISIQKMLQNAFLDAWEALVKAVGDLDGVIGFQMLNEPHRGYIELQSFHRFDYNTDLHYGEIPSVLASYTLGAGYPTTVPFYSRSWPMPTKLTHHVTLNPNGKKVWTVDGPTKGRCLWEMHGVWGWDVSKKQGVVLRENYFKKHPQTGEKVDWYDDFYYPFVSTWAERIRSVPAVRNKMVFVEAIPNEFCPDSWFKKHRIDNMVYAPHWLVARCLYLSYDLNALFNRTFKNLTVNVQGLSRGMFLPLALYWGHSSARDNFSLQLKTLAAKAYASMGENPIVIGECGIPMDINNKQAFSTGDFVWQSRMMDAMITGLERNNLAFTLWNYNHENDNIKGDNWNAENFSWYGNAHRQKSIISPSLSARMKTNLAQINDDLDDGGRILQAVVRPYPAKTAGVPIRWLYEFLDGHAEFEWQILSKEDLKCYETEIFWPSILLSGDRTVELEGLTTSEWTYSRERQTIFVVPSITPPSMEGKYRVTIWLSPPLEPLFTMTTHWQDFSSWYVVLLAILLGICFFIIG